MTASPDMVTKRRTRAATPFLAAAVASALIFLGAFMAAEFDRQATRTHGEAHYADLLHLQSERVESFVDRIAQSLRFIAHLQERDGAPPDLAALVAGNRLDASDVLQFASIDAEGMVRASNLPLGRASVSIADRPHFRAAAQGGDGVQFSRPVLGRVSGQWSVQMVRAVRSESGAFLGVVGASIDTGVLDRLLDVPGFEGGFALIGADGAVRARTPPNSERRNVDDPAHPLVARMRESETGVWEGPPPWAETPKVALWRKVDSHPLYVVAAVPAATLTADATARARYYWAAAGLAAGGTFVFAAFAARRRARLEATLARARAAAIEQARLLDSLGTDLRGPVDILRWSIDTLADPADEPARRRALADLRRADAALARAADDAAVLARLMRDSSAVESRPIDARDWARGAFETARARAGGAGVTCDLALDLPEGLRIVADEKGLRRVAETLLGAAFERAGRSGRVGFSVGARGLDARTVEIAIAVSASGEALRPDAQTGGMATALAQALGGRVERLAGPNGTLDVFKAGFARAA
ncbi:MAG: cache domain-containing protein [Magnetospirillum sp.]|nr:cache domain-containing protein [Magnetospirillum sp.]